MRIYDRSCLGIDRKLLHSIARSMGLDWPLPAAERDGIGLFRSRELIAIFWKPSKP